MHESKMMPAKVKPALLVCLATLIAVSCSSANLGRIDETQSEREDMPGPGIFTEEDGETALKWSADGKRSAEKSAQTSTEVKIDTASTGIEPEQPSAATVQPAQVSTMDEKTEFEEFKKWNRLRTEGANSPEYQEFLLWLKYRQFKN